MLITTFFLLSAIQRFGDSDAIRLIPLVLLAATAVVSTLSKTSPFPEIRKPIMVGPILLMLGLVLPVQSFLVLLTTGESRPLIYSITFSLTLALVGVIVFYRGMQYVLDSFILAAALAAATSIAVDPGQFLSAISASQTDNGLVRFTALGAHPNLTGHNFGCAAVAAYARVLFTPTVKWRTTLILIFILLMFLPLAASSRGGLLSAGAGVLATSGVYLWTHFRHDRSKWVSKNIRLIFGSGLLIILVAIIKSDYFIQMLDMNSAYRGLDSGFTGRTGNWSNLLNMVVDSPRVSLLGAGLRTWDDDLYGFATDSSYLNLVWEIGIPLTVLTVGAFLYLTIMLARDSLGDFNSVASFGILTFFLIESFFARYLLGIGNPSSIVLLAVLVDYSSLKRYQL